MKYFILLPLFTIFHISNSQTNKTYLLVGTYTEGLPKNGIYIFEFNIKTGELKKTGQGKNITNPSYISVSSDGQFIVACTDTKLPQTGNISAFQFDSVKGQLKFINKQNCGGENPVYLNIFPNNTFLIVANYNQGSVAVFRTTKNGQIQSMIQQIMFEGASINKRRQDKSHIHSAVFSPDYQYLFLPDLGADKIRVFKFDTSQIQPLIALENFDIKCSAGSGPRHFIFHPNNPFAYCIEELSGSVTAYKYNNGRLDSVQKIFAYSKVQVEYNSADIQISPDGLFLYASNRWDNENTIAIFSIDTGLGTLTLIEHQTTYGQQPRSFVIDPSGEFLIVANLDTNSLIVFKRNRATGRLTRTNKVIKVPQPACLKMKQYKY